MKNFTIVAPHVDDDIYSCSSVLEHVSRSEDVFFRVLFLSHGRRQEGRRKSIYHIYENIFGIARSKYEIVDLGFFEDGMSSFSNLNHAVAKLDKYMESSTYIFTTGDSHHQDHIITSTLVNAALRFRRSLQGLKGVFQYEYMYNHDQVPSEMFLPLSVTGIQKKLESLQQLNTVDTILNEGSVNSLEYVKSMATINGLRCNYEFAESFKVMYLKSGREGVVL